MVQRRSVAVGVVAVGLVLAGLGWPAGRLGAVPPEDSAVQPKPKAETSAAWTAGEVLTALAFDPQDSYLQYVALQLARREDKVDEVGRKIDELNARPGSFLGGRRERGPVDLFSLFTGALAVQESLQLDTMRGQPGGQAGGQPGRLRQAGPVNDEQDPKAKVSLDRLAGPAVKSHPWDEMLGDQKPEISPLARCVPADFYFIDFRSLNRLLDAVDAADSWGTHLFDQAYHEARTQNTGQRVKTQLVMETNALLRPVYDLIVDEVAVTGSDPFLREGSDVTMLFRARQPGLLKARMDGFLANAEKARADIKRSAGRFLGVDYVHLATADRAVCVYSAYPRADLHVRGNSLPAFKRVLETILGRTEENGGRAAAPVTTIATTRPAGPLGESAEFRYIRTLFPTSAAEEDGLVYLSDPFIRRLVGPQCKLTELHRIQCYNHLRMIGHAALLYHTENGRFPKTLAELAAGRCVPGEFGQGELVCPDGGTYSLSADGSGGVCSIHGHVDFMTPCCEIPLTEATASEADSYRAFLEEYKTYWRVYFDPIAVRLQVRPDKVRVETIVLPLIDNSIYTTLAGVLNGKPEPLETLPVPKRTIFAMAARFDKAAMVAAIGEDPDQAVRSIARDLKVPDEQVGKLDVRKFITEGIGNQVALNVYDADPMFDFNLPGFLGEMLGSLQPTRSMGEGVLIGSVLISSLNAPVYLAVPVQDAKIVDEFLDQLDGLMALAARQRDHRGWFPVDNDFYKFTGEKGQTLRCFAIEFGPIKWRLFYGRVDNGLYIASKRFILEDLAGAGAAAAKADAAKDKDAAPAAHGMVRIRPDGWQRVLPDYRIGWAENNRKACLNNLRPLSNVARAQAARAAGPAKDMPPGPAPELTGRIQQLADRLYGVHFFCPDGGEYVLDKDGRSVVCSIHGSAVAPRQPVAPDAKGVSAKLLDSFAGMTTTLTFEKDGLHAILVIDRK